MHKQQIKMETITNTTIPTTYYENNKDKIKERYIKNAEKNRIYQIEYNLINNDKYTEYQKNYYEEKKEAILRAKREKILCECGKCVSAGHMTTHKKSNIHLKRLAAAQS